MAFLGIGMTAAIAQLALDVGPTTFATSSVNFRTLRELPMPLNVLSLFSGIGAFEWSAKKLGLNILASAEIDEYASSVLSHHYKSPNLGDVRKINGYDLRGDVDVIVGGSPCQNFSQNATAVGASATGLRGRDSQLLMEQIRIAYECEAKVFVWENVLGALTGKGKADLAFIFGLLWECGYSIAYRVLYAPDFGLPQARKRLFVVGFLGRDANGPSRILALNQSHGRIGPTDHPKYRAKPVNEVIGSGVFAFNASRSFNSTMFELCPTLLASKSKKRHESTGANMAIWRNGEFRRIGFREKLRLQGFPDNYFDIPALPDNLNRFKHQMAALSIPVPFCDFVLQGIQREFENSSAA